VGTDVSGQDDRGEGARGKKKAKGKKRGPMGTEGFAQTRREEMAEEAKGEEQRKRISGDTRRAWPSCSTSTRARRKRGVKGMEP